MSFEWQYACQYHYFEIIFMMYLIKIEMRNGLSLTLYQYEYRIIIVILASCVLVEYAISYNFFTRSSSTSYCYTALCFL